MRTLLFVYNLHAGKGVLKAYLPSVLDIFAEAGYLVTVHPTRGKADATRVVAELASGYDRLVCSGGDGTLSEVISGLMAREQRPPLGYIPTGTTNDFSRNLSLPRGLEKQAAVAVGGVPRPCDMGRFNEKPFLYVAAFGAFTDVAYGTPQQFKNIFGHLAYVLEGVGRLNSLKSYSLELEHDSGSLKGDFLFGMVSNTVSVGGFQGLPAKDIKLDDGLFEVVLVRQPAKAGDFQAILRALTLRIPSFDGPVVAFRSGRVKVTCSETVPWTLDGEFGGAPAVAEIRNCRHAVTIIYGK
jgi:YegS/Rv2252/BmrU family lipid kinase